MKKQEGKSPLLLKKDLQKKLEDQSMLIEHLERELVTEASLDRVRAKAIAMQKSQDMAGAVATIFQELDALDLGMLRCGIGIINKENRTVNVWTATLSDKDVPVQISGDESMDTHPLLRGAFNAWLQQQEYAYMLKGEDLTNYYKTQRSASFRLPDSQFLLNAGDDHRQYYFLATFRAGGLFAFRETPFPEEAKKVMKRFADVFNLTYQRFLDLQKAEAQAREANIETALERIRVRTMAMHKSDELSETAAVLFRQLNGLGGEPEGINISLVREEKGLIEWWVTEQGGSQINRSFSVRIDEPTVTSKIYAGWKAKKKSISIDLAGKELSDWVRYMREEIGYPVKEELLRNRRIYSIAFFSEGMIVMVTPEPQAPEIINVLERFAQVFEQTYTRFLDLQKAEEQARRAQIETALERVRSASMAMHKSEELKDVVQVVSDNLRSLGIQKIDSVNINIMHPGSKEFDLWLAAPGQAYTKNFRLPYYDHPIANDFFDAVGRGQVLHKKQYTFDEKNAYFRYMFQYSDNKYLPEERKALILKGPAYSVSAAISEHSAIFLNNYSGDQLAPEDDEILVRFSKVFDQAYKRYIDLQNAELLIRETLKQASLDRVRGQVASMRSTADLQRIIPLIWRELRTLDIPFIRCGIFIFDEATRLMQAYLSAPDGASLGTLHIPYTRDEVSKKVAEHWHNQEILVHHWSREAFLLWMESMIQEGQIQNMESFQGGHAPPESLDLHFIPFAQGMLYVGCTQPLTNYELNLVKKLTDSFAIAYARYEDFIQLEKAKQKTEDALSELQETQKQLIQSEKMASLGVLTAGIAHEIQNPLNFVNNFSEVNRELLLEMKNEIDKGNISEAKAIANDLIVNQEKINHHGMRADGIVKGMLQHSRASSGQKEPTNINNLADEYLRLSYHGMRAKDKSFNADFTTDFDESIGKINIVPQDMGRVLLNLFNNAFYATNAKQKTADENYKPLVIVSTKKINDKIEIKVNDNGNGIPQNIIDKIFQPFFTTKPTGQGTGLGLSLSYDIIKVHGGEIKVETKEGATFTLTIPQ